MEIILEARNLKKSFPARRGAREVLSRSQVKLTTVVDEVSFAVEAGKVLVLAGGSGYGKSTIAKLIIRAENADEGSLILFEGKDVTNYKKDEIKEFREGVQIILQDNYASLDPRMNVMQIVMEPLDIHDKTSTRQQKIAKVRAALAEVHLDEEIESKRPSEISGGERQRVAFARAIIMRPKLIIADEPVSMLDVSTRGEVLKVITHIKEKYGTSFIYITHDLSSARYVGDMLAIVEHGKIVEIGPIDRVLSDPHHPYTKELIKAIPQIPDFTGTK